MLFIVSALLVGAIAGVVVGGWLVLSAGSAVINAACDTKPMPKPSGPVAFKI